MQIGASQAGSKILFEADERECLICKNSTGNRKFSASEKMFASGGAFDYMECGNCKALMLMDVPAEMSTYYPNDYYSYETISPRSGVVERLRNCVMASVIDHRIGSGGPIDAVIAGATGKFEWIRPGMFNKTTAILDLGCGNGSLLSIMHRAGFKDLTGADPYIAEDIEYANGIHIYKAELDELDRSFGFIMLNHTFEHLPKPLAVLSSIGAHLEAGGRAMIRIPVADCWAWRNYGLDWVQLDAPRHLFLHTTKSIEKLVEQCNLELEHVEYDSTEFQFIGSEKYRKGLPLSAQGDHYSNSELKKFREKAAELNRTQVGDTASFYLVKQ